MEKEKFTTFELIIVIVAIVLMGHVFGGLALVFYDIQMTEAVYEDHYIEDMNFRSEVYFAENNTLEFYNVTIETGENLSTTLFNDLEVGSTYRLKIKDFVRHKEWDRRIFNGVKIDGGD